VYGGGIEDVEDMRTQTIREGALLLSKDRPPVLLLCPPLRLVTLHGAQRPHSLSVEALIRLKVQRSIYGKRSWRGTLASAGNMGKATYLVVCVCEVRVMLHTLTRNLFPISVVCGYR
jgi:hypothetical protein